MKSQRFIAHAPRTRSLAQEISALNTPCIGCEGCEGICTALIDVMMVPNFLLRDHAT